MKAQMMVRLMLVFVGLGLFLSVTRIASAQNINAPASINCSEETEDGGDDGGNVDDAE
jgi:hypothetical protein